jgi:uncharacterized membrane protein YfcA
LGDFPVLRGKNKVEIPFFNILQFIVIGTAVGFLGGFLGVGGGIIMIPLLHYWAFPAIQVSPEIIVHLSFGTSLAIIIPTSISSTWAHAKAGNVDWRVLFLLAIPGPIGSLLGSTLAAHLKGPLLKALFGSLLIILSAQMLFQKKGLVESGKISSPRALPTLITGFSVGVFSGFFGLSSAWVGGVLVVPLMVRFLAIPIHRAVGISIAFVFFASMVGTGGYIFNGLDNPHLPPFALGYVYTLGWVLAGIPSIFLAQRGPRWPEKPDPCAWFGHLPSC